VRPALVLTHGFADSAATWAAQLDDLSRDFTVVTWDLPGHGHGPLDLELCSREGALRRLDEEIARAAGQGDGDDVVLVGHSLGGYLSMVRTARNPEGIRALVLIATGPGFRDDTKRERWNASLDAVAAEQGLPHEAARVGHQPDGWLIEHVADITVPALLIVGSEDHAYRDGMAYLDAKLPGAELLVVEGGRHMVHRKHADVVDRAIRDFVG
jgi:pimeloyl-ACP methyl ester carboxylesterase